MPTWASHILTIITFNPNRLAIQALLVDICAKMVAKRAFLMNCWTTLLATHDIRLDIWTFSWVVGLTFEATYWLYRPFFWI